MAIKCKVRPEVDGGTHGRLGVLKAGSEVEWKEDWGPVPEQVLEPCLPSPSVAASSSPSPLAGEGGAERRVREGDGTEDNWDIVSAGQAGEGSGE